MINNPPANIQNLINTHIARYKDHLSPTYPRPQNVRRDEAQYLLDIWRSIEVKHSDPNAMWLLTQQEFLELQDAVEDEKQQAMDDAEYA